jgi:hypothetical protein
MKIKTLDINFLKIGAGGEEEIFWLYENLIVIDFEKDSEKYWTIFPPWP